MIKSKEKIRVLTAEDDYLVAEEISRALKIIGYEKVGEASDGAEAVEMVCRLKPDVVLMDIKMPGMDGLEASGEIQARCPTPVIILTAFESKELLEKASKKGVAAYLTKPPQPEEIERAVIIALARCADLMELQRLYKKVETQKQELEKALAEIKTLQGMIPICATCKKIRNDDGFWQQVENYVMEHSQAEFTHSLCPECHKEIYGDILKKGK